MRKQYGLLQLLTGTLLACTVISANVVAQTPHEGIGDVKRPNVLIWLIDDAGFGHVGAFGGLIDTPNLDALARNGLRYNNFNSTAICSPSRAALLTGRNHHMVGMGNHAGLAADAPGYMAEIPAAAGSMATILKQNGYSTWALGKWDQFPQKYASPDGPYTYWPSGQGFERFYGFLYADMDNFNPLLWSDHTPVDAVKGRKDYHLSADLADKAIEYLDQHYAAAPDKPFFMYWATGAVHAPHHAPRAYIEKYKGRFDMGWDRARELILARQKTLGVVPKDVKLPPREPSVQPWDSLTPDQKRMAARMMEAFAGQLDHADHEFGRIIEDLRRLGQLDNTIIMVMSDNGASAEGGLDGEFSDFKGVFGFHSDWQENLKHYDQWGGPETYPNYPIGWAMAGNTPFRHYKTTEHFGGTRGPMILSWPNGIKGKGEVRTQFHHLVDVMPTVLEAAGIKTPEVIDGLKQQRIDGTSMLYSFNNAAAPDPKHEQYFELFGNRAIWADGWKAVVLRRKEPWNFFKIWPPEDDVWELYHVATDFNETHDLAKSNPAKLAEMEKLFDEEAKRNNVYPLAPDARGYAQAESAKLIKEHNGRFVYRSGGIRRIPNELAPPTTSSFNLKADLVIPPQGAQGVIVAHGGSVGGYTLYVKDNRPAYCYNFFGAESYCIHSAVVLPAGKVSLRFEFRKAPKAQQATGALYVNDREVGDVTISRTSPMWLQASEVFNVGLDEGSRVSDEYGADNAFTGTIEQVVFDVALPASSGMASVGPPQ